MLRASLFKAMWLPVPGLGLCCIVNLLLLPDVLLLIIKGLNPLFGTSLKYSCVSLHKKQTK